MATKKEIDNLAKEIYIAMVTTLKSPSDVGMANPMAKYCYDFAKAFLKAKESQG
jgi:hypothetical protein